MNATINPINAIISSNSSSTVVTEITQVNELIAASHQQLASYPMENLFPLVDTTFASDLPNDLNMKMIKSRQDILIGMHERVNSLIDQASLEINSISTEGMHEFYQHELPLTGIKDSMRFDALESIKCDFMKSQVSLKMAPSQEAVLATAKACELFLLELTLRAWCSKELSQGPAELNKTNILDAVLGVEHFDMFAGLLTYSMGRPTGAKAKAEGRLFESSSAQPKRRRGGHR